VKRGKPKCFSKETLGCGKRFLGLDNTLRPHFNEFLSCGIPGQLEGERYKQTPASIVQYPLLEAQKEHPRAILGMFDVSARPRVNQNVLSFAIPWSKFERMLENAGQTFFTTKSCAK
jgi:Uncharacterised ArCR, COG2043